MPIYEYECVECHRRLEMYRKLGERFIPTSCACGGEAHPIISLPARLPEMGGYYDEGLGAYVESRSHRKQLMKQKGVVEVDKGEPQQGRHKGTIFSLPRS